MVEPGNAFDGGVRAVDADDTGGAQLRATVVVAGLRPEWPLAREARIALQHGRCVGGGVEFERKAPVVDARVVAVGRIARERPAVDGQCGVVARGARQPEAGASGALRVHEAAVFGLGQRGVREQQLRGREATRVGRVVAGARAEERHLHAQRLAAPVAVEAAQPAGEVPPLRAKRRMRAVVARKLQRLAAYDRPIEGISGSEGITGSRGITGGGLGTRGAQPADGGGQRCEHPAARVTAGWVHQSSRNARTGAADMAERAASKAAPTPSASSARPAATSRPIGQDRSMVQ